MRNPYAPQACLEDAPPLLTVSALPHDHLLLGLRLTGPLPRALQIAQRPTVDTGTPFAAQGYHCHLPLNQGVRVTPYQSGIKNVYINACQHYLLMLP